MSWTKQKNVRIDFITLDNGNEDCEFLSDLWAAAREIRPNLPRYSEIKIKGIIIND